MKWGVRRTKEQLARLSGRTLVPTEKSKLPGIVKGGPAAPTRPGMVKGGPSPMPMPKGSRTIVSTQKPKRPIGTIEENPEKRNAIKDAIDKSNLSKGKKELLKTIFAPEPLEENPQNTQRTVEETNAELAEIATTILKSLKKEG